MFPCYFDLRVRITSKDIINRLDESLTFFNFPFFEKIQFCNEHTQKTFAEAIKKEVTNFFMIISSSYEDLDLEGRE
jgi:hypothetical protein